jgi:hypothetical protein
LFQDPATNVASPDNYLNSFLTNYLGETKMGCGIPNVIHNDGLVPTVTENTNGANLGTVTDWTSVILPFAKWAVSWYNGLGAEGSTVTNRGKRFPPGQRKLVQNRRMPKRQWRWWMGNDDGFVDEKTGRPSVTEDVVVFQVNLIDIQASITAGHVVAVNVPGTNSSIVAMNTYSSETAAFADSLTFDLHVPAVPLCGLAFDIYGSGHSGATTRGLEESSITFCNWNASSWDYTQSLEPERSLSSLLDDFLRILRADPKLRSVVTSTLSELKEPCLNSDELYSKGFVSLGVCESPLSLDNDEKVDNSKSTPKECKLDTPLTTSSKSSGVLLTPPVRRPTLAGLRVGSFSGSG